jgi:hypothetical protein
VADSETVNSRYGVSIQKGTSSVPDDGRYHVVADGEIVLSTGVEAAAIAEFDDIRDQRRLARSKRLRDELGDNAFRLMRSESWAEKSRRDSRRGGRGVGR